MTDLQSRLEAALAARYAIDRLIGQGGSASVYLATDLKHRRPVALKVLHPGLAAPLGADRFLREITTAARLQHPHILPVHDSGEADGLLYYTMPYVDGESLRQRLNREGAVSVATAVRLLREILEALGYAHDLGIVHRDVKPENVMLSGRHALLTDFGIAKALSGGATTMSLTAAGLSIGTPAYMAPEQAASGQAIDHRTDLYAVGVLAYELLAGRPPFLGTALQILTAHAREPAPPLPAERSDVPAALSDLVMRSLNKHPDERWQSAAEMLVRLDAVDAARSSGPPMRRPAAPTVRAFRLTDDVCRQLDRASLDPRMIGDSLVYLDNEVESDVLVCCVPGTGLDHRDFETVLSESPYHAVAPTFYGWEPDARRRMSLPLASHLLLVRALLQDVIARIRPARVIALGYSAGADVLLRMLQTPLGVGHVDALLSLDCNLSFDTCFVTRVLSRMSIDEPARVLEDLRHVGEHAVTIEEWVKIHDYLVKILQKFHGDVGPLRRFAADIVEPFAASGTGAFVDAFAGALAVVPIVRCVFSDVDANNAALDKIKLENLDRSILGPHYRPECIVTEPGSKHFDLKDPALVRRHVESVVSRVRQPAIGTMGDHT